MMTAPQHRGQDARTPTSSASRALPSSATRLTWVDILVVYAPSSVATGAARSQTPTEHTRAGRSDAPQRGEREAAC
jgi:hypothetical protein